MRYSFLLLVILFYSCNPTTEKKDKFNLEEETKSINNFLNNWHQAAANADLANYIGAMDSDSYYIGTDATENWTRTEFEKFCKPYFDKKTTWDFTAIDRNIYFNEQGNTTWFDEILKTHMGTCRGSGTLVRTENDWKIKHYVLSMAIPNDATEAVKAAKQKEDDAFLKNYE